MKVKFSDFEVEAKEVSPGLRVISALRHSIVFEDGEALAPNPGLEKVVSATFTESVFEKVGEAELVTVREEPTAEGLEALQKFQEEYPGIRVVSSLVSVKAYREHFLGLVVTSVTTKETFRLPPAEKRVMRTKWTC